MQCSFRLESDGYSGNNKMKTINNFKNPYRKETNLDNIVDQLAIRLQHIKDKEVAPVVGMPTCSVEQAEAVRRYYAAFPALKKGEHSPLQYYMPPPAWCRDTARNEKQPPTMQSETASLANEWNVKIKKFHHPKERRNSYHGQRKNGKKRCNSYSRSFESKESLPEWVTSEGVWDMESQDPVREFIRAIALDEGYGTAEHTVAEDVRCVPQWAEPDPLAPRDLHPDPCDTELYAKFEAKFDRSLEALWDQNTPIDDYQELPIDFAELLSSPSDRMFGPGPGLPPPAFDAFTSLSSLPSLPSLPSLGDSVWAAEASRPSPPLHDRFRPLNLASPRPPPPPELESFALLEGEELYDALTTVASTMRSFTAINHSRDTSGFAEVPPRRHASDRPAPPPAYIEPRPAPDAPKEDLLTSQRTHFRPIRREGSAEAPRYADGDTFDIRGSIEPVEFRRSESGGAYLTSGGERYLEYRAGSVVRGIDYSRLALTVAQREQMTALPLRFAVRQHDAAVQTDPPTPPPPPQPAAPDRDAVAAKKMRSVAMETEGGGGGETQGGGLDAEGVLRDWEELLADIRLAHAAYAAEGGGDALPADRKRRHSAARHCAHPHARFLPCCAHLRPLTR